MYRTHPKSRGWPRAVLAAVLLAVVAPTTVALASPSTVGAAPAPGGLDHFLCYPATPVAGVPPLKAPRGVKLVDQFSVVNKAGVPKPFTAKFGAVVAHCNPAIKVVQLPAGPQTFPPKSPSWHLACMSITTNQRTAVHVVTVSNQFGTANLDTTPPTEFCLPSLKSLASPPVFNPPGPGEVQPDHFTCYPVSYDPKTPGRFVPPGPVLAGDQFNGFTPAPLQVATPTRLCLPTQKTIKGVVTPITNPQAHLLCFSIQTSEAPFTGTVWDRNQFGTAALALRPANELCLPSFKTVIK